MWTPQRLYSQNFEDLYLYRLFSGVDKGFYIDAGAWLPRADNVTAIFYDQGWRGVNIEPVKEVFDILSGERIHDVNLCLAVVGDPSAQTIPIMVAGDDPTAWGHHHLLPTEQADLPSVYDRHTTAVRRDVPASTLREIVEKYAASQQINFLKLDVEGYEHKALLGLDIKTLSLRQRPQVVLLEVTTPGTRLSAPHRQQCREYFLDNSYQFLFYDGLNDYYCLSELYEDFAPKMIPPNVFDRPAIIASQIFANAEHLGVVSRDCAGLREQLTVFQEEKEVLEKEMGDVRVEKEGLEKELGDVRVEKEVLEQGLSDAREESELLLLQLHQVQEELEHYFLEANQLRSNLETLGIRKRAEREEKESLALQLQHNLILLEGLQAEYKLKDEKLAWLRSQRQLLTDAEQEEKENLVLQLQQNLILLDALETECKLKDQKLEWLRSQRQLLIDLVKYQFNVFGRFADLNLRFKCSKNSGRKLQLGGLTRMQGILPSLSQ